MPKRIEIPMFDIKGLSTLVQEGKTQEEIADYYGVDQATISRKFQEIGNLLAQVGYALQDTFKPVQKAIVNMDNDPEFMDALREVAKQSKNNKYIDEWEFVCKERPISLKPHTYGIVVPTGNFEYKFETTFGEKCSFVVKDTFLGCNTHLVDIPVNAGCLYIFRKKVIDLRERGGTARRPPPLGGDESEASHFSK